MPVREYCTKSYFTKLNFEALQFFQVPNGKKGEASSNTPASSSNLQKTSKCFEMMLADLQRSIITSWKTSQIKDLINIAESDKNLVNVDLEIYSRQAQYIILGHSCKLVRKMLLEIFDNITDFQYLSLSVMFSQINMEQRYLHSDDVDNLVGELGISGNYFHEQSSIKKVMKDSYSSNVCKEDEMWMEELVCKKKDIKARYPNFEEIYGEYVTGKDCAEMINQLLANTLSGSTGALGLVEIINISNFHEFYEQQNGLTEEKKHLSKALQAPKNIKQSYTVFQKKFQFRADSLLVDFSDKF